MCRPIFGYPALPFLAMIECAGDGIIDLYRITCRYIGHGMQELFSEPKRTNPCGRKSIVIIAWVGTRILIGASSCLDLVPTVVP